MNSNSPNNIIDLIVQNIVPILIILFVIMSRLTRLNKKSEEIGEDTSNTENKAEHDVKEQLRHLIEQRRNTSTQTHHKESVFTETTHRIPEESVAYEDLMEKEEDTYVTSYPISEMQPYSASKHLAKGLPPVITFQDYTERLAEQQKKVTEARALHTQIAKDEIYLTNESSGSITLDYNKDRKTLSQVFANKSPLQQAILAKEILDQPAALRSLHPF